MTNEISGKFNEGSDLGKREEAVLEEVSRLTGFSPERLLSRSAWWGSSEIGAFHYLGKYEGKEIVLKVQGVRPATSEIEMIKSFAATSKSKILRPPHLYFSIPWSDEKRYEALLLEYVQGNHVVNLPTNDRELEEFFGLYRDYRENCLGSPWVEKPTESLSERVRARFADWRKSSFKIYPNHPLRKEGDLKLIDEAVEILARGYSQVEPEFGDGHLSDGDFIKVEGQVVIFSNLYWGWRAPCYDAVFGYHWFMYHLSGVVGITPEKVEEQRSLWMKHISGLGLDERLLNLALLERAAAGLNLDALSVDPEVPIAGHLVSKTREQVRNLIAVLS